MISGKSFANICKWVLDPRYPEREQFFYAKAQDKDWVFVNGDYLHEYIHRIPIFPRNKQFNLIIHNSDASFTPEVFSRLPCIEHVYAINTTFRHPSVTTIPIGFVDRQLPFLQSFSYPDQPRDIEIYSNFTTVTNTQKRSECLNAFSNDTRVVHRSNISVPEYYADLCRSKFVLCPEGTGIDTHRVYESILCGATPVVVRNSLSHLYEKLPVCIVESWNSPLVEQNQMNVNWNCQSFLT